MIIINFSCIKKGIFLLFYQFNIIDCHTLLEASPSFQFANLGYILLKPYKLTAEERLRYVPQASRGLIWDLYYLSAEISCSAVINLIALSILESCILSMFLEDAYLYTTVALSELRMNLRPSTQAGWLIFARIVLCRGYNTLSSSSDLCV